MLIASRPLRVQDRGYLDGGAKDHQGVARNAWLTARRPSVYYGVRYFIDTATDLRVPDLGRNKNMMFSSCHFHMLYAEDGYTSCHDEYGSGDA